MLLNLPPWIISLPCKYHSVCYSLVPFHKFSCLCHSLFQRIIEYHCSLKENNLFSSLCKIHYNPHPTFIFSLSIWQDPTPAYHSHAFHIPAPIYLPSFYVHILKTSHPSLFVQVILSFEHPLSFSTSSLDPPLFKLLPVPVYDFVISVLLSTGICFNNLLGYELLCILSYTCWHCSPIYIDAHPDSKSTTISCPRGK